MPLVEPMLEKRTGSKLRFKTGLFFTDTSRFHLLKKLANDDYSARRAVSIRTIGCCLLYKCGRMFPISYGSYVRTFRSSNISDDLFGNPEKTSDLLEKTACNTPGLQRSKSQAEPSSVYPGYWWSAYLWSNHRRRMIKLYPRQYEAPTNMLVPITIDALEEIVREANWMRSAIPNFFKFISILVDVL